MAKRQNNIKMGYIPAQFCLLYADNHRYLFFQQPLISRKNSRGADKMAQFSPRITLLTAISVTITLLKLSPGYGWEKRWPPSNQRGKPNIKITYLHLQPSEQIKGKKVKVLYKIKNDGTAAINRKFFVRIYFSKDKILGNTGDVILKTFYISHLPAGATTPGTPFQEIVIPQILPAGPGYIALFADYNGMIGETDESDNTYFAPFKVLEDLDRDGVPKGIDCDDSDKEVYPSYRGRPAAKEKCDGKDNDCDKKIDENCQCRSGTKKPCYPYPKGCQELPNGSFQCRGNCSAGIKICQNGRWSPCRGFAIPSPEICDGKDNDCDGLIDEFLSVKCYPPNARGCKRANNSFQCTGTCKPGKSHCSLGKWSPCRGFSIPSPEICDGKDNDCDGLIDEFLSRTCFTGQTGCTKQTGGTYQCNSPCRAGKQLCQNGKWGQCSGEVLPQTEICDGIDNDCDGLIDEVKKCHRDETEPSEERGEKSGDKTEERSELIPKEPGAIEEPPNFAESRESLPEEMKNTESEPKGEQPDRENPPEITPDGGEPESEEREEPEEKFLEREAEVQNEIHLEKTGDLDCYQRRCPAGQICQRGICLPDPCKGVVCSKGEFCRNGQCVKSCGCKVCAPNEKCIDGYCSIDPCVGIICQKGKFCEFDTGLCLDNRCKGVSCPKGMLCDKKTGRCIDDPCRSISCPPGQSCQNGQCYGVNCPKREQPSKEFPPKEPNPETSQETVRDEPYSRKDTEPPKEKPLEEKTLSESGELASESNVKKESNQPREKESKENSSTSESSPEINFSEHPGICGCGINNFKIVFWPVLFLLIMAVRKRQIWGEERDA